MHDYTELVARYKQLRKVSTVINNGLVETLGRDVLQEGGRKLGVIRDGIFVFRSEDETSVLMDYCIYNVRRNGMNAVQRHLLETSPAEGSDELLLLTAMVAARYSIFQAQKVIAGVGVEMLDVLRQDKVLVVDMGFSQTAVEGFVVASRLISAGDFWMTGGAPVPLSVESLQGILHRMPNLLGTGAADWGRMPIEMEADFVATVVRAGLESSDGPDIRYEDPRLLEGGRGVTVQRITKAATVGRNEPCPCGSGKKYKKCCGR